MRRRAKGKLESLIGREEEKIESAESRLSNLQEEIKKKKNRIKELKEKKGDLERLKEQFNELTDTTKGG